MSTTTATETAAPPPAAPAAPPAAAAAPAAAPSIFDAVPTAAPPAGADGKPARPEWLAEPFWDPVKGEPRLESLARSQADLRARVARGEGVLPEAPDGYALPAVEGLPDNYIPPADPVWTDVRSAAHKAGVTQTQMEAIVRPYLAHVARIRAEQPPADPAAQQAQQAEALRAEIGKLGSSGPQIVREIGGWIAGMEARGSLTAEEAAALRDVGTAAGVRALLKLRELGGEQAIPVTALDDAAMTEDEARRTLVEGYRANDQALLAKGRRALEALQKRGGLGAR
jgi:hypothetical protein